jgi:hypothetical protein
VDESNKAEFVRLASRFRLTRGTEEQMIAFKTGFTEILDLNALTVFDERELDVRYHSFHVTPRAFFFYFFPFNPYSCLR